MLGTNDRNEYNTTYEHIVHTIEKETKMNQLQIQKIKSTIFRVVCDTTESGVYYVVKGKSGSWSVRKNGEILDFAPNKPMAIALAINLWEPK